MYHLCVYYAMQGRQPYILLCIPTYPKNQPTWYAKSRGDYFKAAIPMMPEENKAIASFSLDNFLDLNFMLHIQFYAQLFLKQFIFKNCVHFCQLNSRVLVRWPKDLMCNVKFETQKSFIFTYYVRIAVRKLVQSFVLGPRLHSGSKSLKSAKEVINLVSFHELFKHLSTIIQFSCHIFEICQTAGGIRVMDQFHDFLNPIFGGVFSIWLNCALLAAKIQILQLRIFNLPCLATPI